VQNQEMVEAKVIGGQFFSFLYSFDYLSTEVNQKKIKRCNQPNSLTDKEKAIISDGLSSVAPPLRLERRTPSLTVMCSNQLS
jgi:hypothetical protein